MRAEHVVRYADLDLNRHANNASYVSWALEALPLDVRESRWPAVMDIDFLAEAVLNDSLVSEAETAPAPASDMGFIHRIAHADGRELALLRSGWRRGGVGAG